MHVTGHKALNIVANSRPGEALYVAAWKMIEQNSKEFFMSQIKLKAIQLLQW